MTSEFVIELAQRSIELALLLAGPAMIFSLATGLLVSVLQAVTQINEATLTFVPKILAVAIALAIFFPWMLSLMIGFTSDLLVSIPSVIR